MKSDLQQIQEQVRANYEPLRKQSLARVARWVYATGPLFSFLPMWNERLQRKPGREVDSAKKAKLKYGFDAQGRLVYSFDDIYKDGAFSAEEFLVQQDGRTFLAYFSRSCSKVFKPWSIQDYRLCELVFDRIARVVQSIHTNGTSTYVWDGDRLVRIEHQSKEGKSHEEFRYDALGSLTEIWQVSATRTLRYRRPPGGLTTTSLEPAIREKLLAAIKKTAEAAGIKQPIYCLALAYDGEGNDVLPPCIGFGLESERQQWLREMGKEAKCMIWNPAEFTHYEKRHTQLKDKELDKACSLYNDLLRPKENFAPAVKLLLSVAAELGKVDWSGKLQVTPDFVVYAVDFELADLNRNLNQIIPARLLAKLKKTKLL